MCLANITDGNQYTPLTAFRCAKFHEGVLCSSCIRNHFMRQNKCQPCDESGLSDTAVNMIVALSVTTILVVVLLLCLRRNGKTMNRRLLLERNDLDKRRKNIMKTISSGLSIWNLEDKDGASSDDSSSKAMSSKEKLHHRLMYIVLRMKTYGVDAANGMVKVAQTGDFLGETGRIVLGFGQVLHHLCT